MKNQSLILIISGALTVLFACKEKRTDNPKDTFIQVLSIIKGEIKHIDTSLYSIIKVNYKDNAPSDTEYVRREDVRLFAKDFLELPELSKKKYTEENIPGPIDNLSTITYKPIHPNNEEVQRVDLIIDPARAETGENIIKSIFVDRGFSNKDSAVQKKMIWIVDQSFQITTILQKKGQEETTTTFKVIWNEDDQK